MFIHKDVGFNEANTFLGSVELEWLKTIFEKQILQYLTEDYDEFSDKIDIKGTHKGYYCNAELVQHLNYWTAILYFGQESVKDLQEQFKIFVEITQSSSEPTYELKNAFLRDEHYPLRLIPTALSKVFNTSSFN
ncbi:hypothetical protein [Acinetobacter sp. Marseille-Q1618]|uniref:hypothetical protein n=1 Tax=Acinetobacter sp. Marseille-Q1618 TaxID=2697502 RepID=UPI00156DAC35|nr:hypothetical protein [Acinetobacter sp. Marseille-Q1618]